MNRGPPTTPFDHWFNASDDDRPEYVGLSRDEAEAAARSRGFVHVRLFEMPLPEWPGYVAWTSDKKPDRLNLVTKDGQVVRAAAF